MPYRFPPYGASVKYSDKISFLLRRRSSCSALKDSTTFDHSVRGRSSKSRTTCMVIVDAPETTRNDVASCQSALATATGSTPQCNQNRRSSMAHVAATTWGLISLSATGTMKFPSLFARNNGCFGEMQRFTKPGKAFACLPRLLRRPVAAMHVRLNADDIIERPPIIINEFGNDLVSVRCIRPIIVN